MLIVRLILSLCLLLQKHIIFLIVPAAAGPDSLFWVCSNGNTFLHIVVFNSAKKKYFLHVVELCRALCGADQAE